MEWDDRLVGAVCGGSGCWEGTPFATLPDTALPEVVPSSDRAIGSVYGVPLRLRKRAAPGGVIVGAILGDQEAASASETDVLTLLVPSNGDMYLVPAFGGLFALHWRPDARGCVVGITASHTNAHFRAMSWTFRW